MDFKKICILIISLVVVFSCSSKKKIIYMQGIDNNTLTSVKFQEYKLKVDDILKIDINPKSFDLKSVSANSSQNNYNSKEIMLLNGYNVDYNGYIDVPEIGKFKVDGLTLSEVKEYLYNYLNDNKIFIEPIIDLKLLNGSFTVLGEVNNPGTFEFISNNFNILEALGYAGDLKIDGKRTDIKLIRESQKKFDVYSIDLTKSDFFEGDAFQVLPGDIIVVNPNPTRVKNAGIIGNSGTLLSLLSFILSSIIVINN